MNYLTKFDNAEEYYLFIESAGTECIPNVSKVMSMEADVTTHYFYNEGAIVGTNLPNTAQTAICTVTFNGIKSLPAVLETNTNTSADGYSSSSFPTKLSVYQNINNVSSFVGTLYFGNDILVYTK